MKFTMMEFNDFDNEDGSLLAINAKLFDKNLAKMLVKCKSDECGCRFEPVRKKYHVYFGYGSTSDGKENGWWIVSTKDVKPNYVPVYVFRKVGIENE